MDKSRTREIKFRGKRVDNGEWEIGHLLKSASTLIAVDSEIVDGRWKLHEVDPATVGQYAWRKDKNGQEIYEGDILSRKEWGSNYNYRAVVRWLERTASFGYELVAVNKDRRGMSDGACELFEADENNRVNFEVIGNIYEHHGLMEEK